MCRSPMFKAAMRTQNDGQGMVEYALIIAFVAVAIVGTLGLFTAGIEASFQSAVNAFP